MTHLLLPSGKLAAAINPTLTTDTGGKIKCSLSIIKDLLATLPVSMVTSKQKQEKQDECRTNSD